MNLTIRAPIVLLLFFVSARVHAQNKPYRLPAVDLKQRVIWGSECIVDDNLGVAFGGADQESKNGQPPTMIRKAGKWQELDRARGPIDMNRSAIWFHTEDVSDELQRLRARLRHQYFEGILAQNEGAEINEAINDLPIRGKADFPAADEATQSAVVFAGLKLLEQGSKPLLDDATLPLVEFLKGLEPREICLRQAGELLHSELDNTLPQPPPRALSPIVYDKSSGLFFLYAGDHLDYLTNDTWIFDPKESRWQLRLPKSAPSPRANHKLTAHGDGTITLSGGYTYANNTDYMGGQYVDIGDREWTYDVAKNEWSGGKGVSPLTRTYRTGKFHPDYFLQGPRPDREAHAKVLESLPSNEWVSLKPPHLPEMNRDWGTAVLDPDRDLILRWSGGHCAHSGSDVLHYHIATNRWELPFPVEFPLGQCYVNTEFPEGVNFNGRPWVTGHTYQNYGYDPVLKMMIFTGRAKDYFVYKPHIADWYSNIIDWPGRLPKPEGMSYDSCFYTLTLTPTPQGLICWTGEGRIFQFEAKEKLWTERTLSGEKLPGAVVDNSTIVYDSKRHRLLAVMKPYGDKARFSGELYAVDCTSWKVSRLKPEGHEAAPAIPYLCQLRYDAEHDLLLVGGTLPPDEAGLRRTPAYDCAGNRWVSLKITGDDPSGPKGRNVSLGMMYDAKRKLFFAVDTKSNVFVLRLEPSKADVQPLKQ